MEIQEFIHSVERLRGDLLRQARLMLDSEEDAEDAVQETLVKLWMARDRIEDSSKMRNMSTVVCRNVALNMLRDAKQSVPIETAEEPTMRDNPQVLLEERENRKRLKRSIETLTDKQRAILRMRNVENMSYADIAKIIGTSESSVRGMISKARLALLKQISLCAVLVIGFSVIMTQDWTIQNPAAEVCTSEETDTQHATINTSELLEVIDMLTDIEPDDATITVLRQDDGFVVNTVSTDGQNNSYTLRLSSDDSTIELISEIIDL